MATTLRPTGIKLNRAEDKNRQTEFMFVCFLLVYVCVCFSSEHRNVGSLAHLVGLAGEVKKQSGLVGLLAGLLNSELCRGRCPQNKPLLSKFPSHSAQNPGIICHN